MKKHTPLALALAGLLAVSSIGTAIAVGDNEPPTPGQTLSDYMGDDNDAQWDKVQTWIEAEYGEGANPTPDPEPEPTPDPTPEPTPDPEPTEEPATGIESGEVKWTTTGVTFEGKIHGTKAGDRVQIRTDTKELTGQRGFYEYEFVRTDGTVKFILTDYRTPQDKLFWHIAIGGTDTTYGNVVANGEVTKPASTPTPTPSTPAPTPEPTPTPTTPPTTGEGNTNGTGGAYTNRTFQSYTSVGLTSRYHVYADGLDRSKPIGILMYADGSGAYGFKNPTQSYLIGGTNGLAAVAKKHNMVLVIPEAPAPGCDGTDNCWYDSNLSAAANKATWSSNLMTHIKGQYPIDLSRVVVGGYSSGAQWTTQTFLPAHGVNQSVDLAVAIAYGGAPRSPMNAPAAWKNDVVMVWDTGTADSAYTTASYGARGGFNHYTSAGFKTHGVWPAGVGHSRGGQFGPIMDREITNRLR